MAKELEIKIKIDGQEVDIAKKSAKELTDQISQLKDKLNKLPMGSPELKKVQGDIDALEKGFQKAKFATQPFVESLSQLPGVAGLAGNSLKGLKGGMDLLAANPMVAVFGLLASVVVKVSEKLKDMEGVMDPLEKISAIFGATMSKIANFILPPIAATIELVATGFEKLMDVMGKIGGNSSEVGKNMSYVAETMDHLNDTNAQFQVSQAAANRQLMEAREIAGDATKSIGERVQALKDAEKIERDIAEKARARQLQEARARAVELAVSLGYNDQQIEGIRKYDAAKLASFAAEIQGMKGLNREKSNALYTNLGNIEESAAQEAKIGKKTQSQITSLEKEEKSKRVEEAKKAAEQTKDYESRLAAFQNDTRLQGIKDEQEKARISLELDKQKSITEINNLQLSTARKNSLRKAAEEDFAAKSKALIEKQNEENLKKTEDFNNKVKDLQIAAMDDETKRNIATREEKYNRDVAAMQKDKEFLKKSETEKADILKNMEKAKNVDIQKINDDAAKKNADLVYKQIEFERQSRIQGLQNRLKDIELSFKSEYDLIEERRKVLDEQAKIDEDKEIENLQKLLDSKEIKNEEFLKRKAILEQKYDLQIKENAIKSSQELQKAKLAEYAAYAQLGQAIGAVADAMGAESEAGKALKVVSQGLILVSQTLTFVRQVQALTTMAAAEAEGVLKGSSLPFPGNLVAIATTVATFASIIVSVKGLIDLAKSGGGGGASSSPNTPAEKTLPQGYGAGGLLEGPRHAEGGIMINAEGGEAVMTRGAVTMFGPLLSQLNQMGGGTSFMSGVTGQAYGDAPETNNPQIQQPIIKTYVVSSEMTTEQQKQSRLKDLSTL